MSYVHLKKNSRITFLRKPLNINRLNKETVDCNYGLINGFEIEYEDDVLKKNETNQIECSKNQKIVIILTLKNINGGANLFLHDEKKPRIEVKQSEDNSNTFSTYIKYEDYIETITREEPLLNNNGSPILDENEEPVICQIEDKIYEVQIPIFDKERQLIEGNLKFSTNVIAKIEEPYTEKSIFSVKDADPPTCKSGLGFALAYISYWPSFGR